MKNQSVTSNRKWNSGWFIRAGSFWISLGSYTRHFELGYLNEGRRLHIHTKKLTVDHISDTIVVKQVFITNILLIYVTLDGEWNKLKQLGL